MNVIATCHNVHIVNLYEMMCYIMKNNVEKFIEMLNAKHAYHKFNKFVDEKTNTCAYIDTNPCADNSFIISLFPDNALPYVYFMQISMYYPEKHTYECSVFEYDIDDENCISDMYADYCKMFAPYIA